MHNVHISLQHFHTLGLVFQFHGSGPTLHSCAFAATPVTIHMARRVTDYEQRTLPETGRRDAETR